MWDTIVIGVNACGNHVRDKRNCHKRFDDIRSKLKKKIQHQRVHATGTGGGPTPQRLILSPLEELLRAKLLPVVVEGLPGDRDIGIYPSQFPPVAPEGHVSPETEQVSSPGSASSTHLEEHDEEDYDDDDDDDDATAIDTQIEASDHEDVPIETVLPANRPANTTYDAIVASEGKIVEAENRRHSDLMTVLERMIALQEETVSQLAHLHRVFIEVPKQLQKINTSFEALVVQQTQANYWRMTNVPQFNTSQPGSVHAGQFSPHSSDIHSPGPNVTGQVADIAVQVPDDILPLPSVQIQQQTPTKEPTKTKHKQLLLTRLPCLQLHNSRIDWTDTLPIQWPSSAEVVPTVPPVVVLAGLDSVPADRSTLPADRLTLPAVYHDYLDVFNKIQAEVLPPHRLYDCPVDLIPGTFASETEAKEIPEPILPAKCIISANNFDVLDEINKAQAHIPSRFRELQQSQQQGGNFTDIEQEKQTEENTQITPKALKDLFKEMQGVFQVALDKAATELKQV
ncbi:uncharacterized protein LOC142488245 [Ascaphus truei]|uniref:uncharacterized protein LOC142488245 n=1 Tax=Ascaphus truei TaxID=8439 RepID=UPI003F590F77